MVALSIPGAIINRSKIERPVPSGHWVQRPRVEARLDRTLSRALTMVTAPAGHGKTSTIVSWLRLRGIDAAWVSVDHRDADLTRFATHVAAALDHVAPGVAPNLFALLAAPDRLAPHDLGEAFGDALYDLDQDVVLVLDDFHAAGPGAVAGFVAGLLHAAPRRLHTILSSRGKPPFPLARLRITGDVEELTGADLRFSPEETGQLLHLETGDFVDSELATTVQASVGGWPAAIRLIALSRGANEDTRPLAAVGERQDQLLFDYLGEEVLARLPQPQRVLLIRASLVHRFNLPLLEALAAVDGGEQIARDELEHLRALELYREIPGLSETWFAYHPLFRDVLRRELARTTDAAGIADLQRSIARWFSDANLTREAVHHLVAVDDITAATSLITSRLSDAFSREDWQSVASWLRLIPAEEIQGSPELLLALAWVAYLSGRDSRIVDILAKMRDPAILDRVTAAQRAEMALLADWPEGDAAACITNAEDAIARIPPDKRYRYGYAHLALGMALATAGRDDEALARLAAFTERESAQIDAASIRGYFGRVVVLWQAARLTSCARAAADQLQLAQMNALPVSAGWGALFLGVIAHERGELDQAARHFEAVFAGAEQLHFLCVRDAFFAQALGYEARGLRSEADRTIARVRELVIAAESHRQLKIVDSFIARIALIRGDLATARHWLDVSSPALADDDLKAIEHPLLTRVKVLIALGTEAALAEADGLLAEFMTFARAQHMRLALLESLAVQALLHEAMGERAPAMRALRLSLEMAAPEGIVQRYASLGPALAPILRRLLAEHAPIPHVGKALRALETVLATLPAPARVAATSHPDSLESPLTERELDVLSRLALRLTNNEIGDELFISPITVKHHVANLSGKLGVSGRRAAVARAIELGLIS